MYKFVMKVHILSRPEALKRRANKFWHVHKIFKQNNLNAQDNANFDHKNKGTKRFYKCKEHVVGEWRPIQFPSINAKIRAFENALISPLELPVKSKMKNNDKKKIT